MDRAVKAAVTIIYGSVVAAVGAVVALAGAPDFSSERTSARVAAGIVIALGMGLPYLAAAIEQLWRRREERAQPLLQNLAERLRETIASVTKLERNDVGVHVYVVRRRRWPPWRFEMVRVARSAWYERSPDPIHAAFRQNWRTRLAPGVTGRAWQEGALEKENLATPEIQNASEDQWNAWLHDDDRRARRTTFERFRRHNNFSTVWAHPTNTEHGINGMITVNVELEVADGHQRLLDADTSAMLHAEARQAGLAIG